MNSNSKSDCIDKIMSKFGGLSGGLSDLDIFDAMAFIDYGFSCDEIISVLGLRKKKYELAAKLLSNGFSKEEIEKILADRFLDLKKSSVDDIFNEELRNKSLDKKPF